MEATKAFIGQGHAPVKGMLHDRPITSMEDFLYEVEMTLVFLEVHRKQLNDSFEAEPWLDQVVMPIGLLIRHLENVVSNGYRIMRNNKR